VLQLPFCDFRKHTTALHYRYEHANVLHFCSFCKPTFTGATRESDALYVVGIQTTEGRAMKRFMSNEFRVEENIPDLFDVLSRNFVPEILKKTKKNLWGDDGIPAEIRTNCLWNARIERYGINRINSLLK
jgi:hypothetical protein